MESSDTRYAQSGDVHIAYRVFGAGPPDLVFASGLDFPSVEFHEEFSGQDFGELTDRMRVIRFDKRGTGASDRVSGVPSLEERMDDVRAVMDAAGVERAALLGHVDGAAMAILFQRPARAIRCACAIRDAVTSLGLEIRVGLHTGECDVVDGKLAGLAVAVGARVAAQAEAGEVLVSGTVKDLVAGSGIGFDAHGVRELKGLGEWPLYAVSALGDDQPA